MRKYSIAIWAIFVAISIVGGSVSQARAEALRIAMVLWRGETAAEQGFKDGLQKLGYTVEYTIVNAEQNRTALRSKLEKTVLPRLESFNYIYSFGTTASHMTKDLVRGKVPQLFNIIAAPVKAGIVRSIEEPGDNISGASNAVPLATQMQAAMKLFKIKRLGLLFNPREKNAMIQREQLRTIAGKYGFEVVDLRSPPALDMLEENLQKLADKSVTVDAVYLPSDSFLISKSELIGSKLRAAKIKSIGAIRTQVAGGVLMGVVPDYHELGVAVAGILDRNRKGEQLGRIPVYVTQAPKLVVNEQTRAELGLQIPAAVLSTAEVVK
jgi:putative ABC transport system substrate-binding protein